jgi:hypothetical protein
MERYEQNERDLGERGSLSKTDRDATFMRMKDDRMGNGQLKAAYNIQVGTEGQFIIDATAHPKPGDTACMIEHLEHAEATIGWMPEEVVADAGYGSEQNYHFLDERDITAYVKHNEFYRESRNRKWHKDPMAPPTGATTPSWIPSPALRGARSGSATSSAPKLTWATGPMCASTNAHPAMDAP